ncbi:MAG: mandelate racemase/muconate lactonizing enzyme family protein [Hyphomicrobiales bacterium]|nr:mandelate racemase/muconate lactonizing enzyme family protein [Hyphomicrobiales bacterium]
MTIVARIEPLVYRVPVETPVATSFGIMRDRPALFIHVLDEDGAEGWGEVWCNFPSVGAEHRARLVAETLAPMIVGKDWNDPAEIYRHLTARTEVLAIQSGEHGPLAQAIAGIDQALWDLFARRAGMPLYRYLGGAHARTVPVYASGINADEPEKLTARKLEEGYRRFKLKVGFGRDKDLRNLRALREILGDETPIMIDANQAWDRETATEMALACAAFAPAWLEEPMRADTPAGKWAELSRRSPIPLAAGENIRGAANFESAVASMGLRYLQPDIGKWGGLTGCLPICRKTLASGLVYCPHWLGGGIGLVASLHLLAAVGGSGALEVDANPNPLREAHLDQLGPIENGRIGIPQGAGLGVAARMEEMARYSVPI